MDCGGRPRAAPRPCSIAQASLPGARLVAPRDGAIYGWTVRGLAASLRFRSSGAERSLQAAKSQYELVPDERPHRFRTNFGPARRHRRVEVTPGATVGVRRGWTARPRSAGWRSRFAEATSARPTAAPGTSFDHELLLRADYFEGQKQRLPHRVFGSDASGAAWASAGAQGAQVPGWALRRGGDRREWGGGSRSTS